MTILYRAFISVQKKTTRMKKKLGKAKTIVTPRPAVKISGKFHNLLVHHEELES